MQYDVRRSSPPPSDVPVSDLLAPTDISGGTLWIHARGVYVMQGADVRAAWYDAIPVWHRIVLTNATVTLVVTENAKIAYTGRLSAANAAAVATAISLNPVALGSISEGIPSWLANAKVGIETSIIFTSAPQIVAMSSDKPPFYYWEGTPGTFTLDAGTEIPDSLIYSRLPPVWRAVGDAGGTAGTAVSRAINLTGGGGTQIYARCTDGGAGLARSGIMIGGSVAAGATTPHGVMTYPFIFGWASGLTYGAGVTSGDDCSGSAIRFNDISTAVGANINNISRIIYCIWTPGYIGSSSITASFKVAFSAPGMKADSTNGCFIRALSPGTANNWTLPQAHEIHDSSGNLYLPFTYTRAQTVANNVFVS